MADPTPKERAVTALYNSRLHLRFPRAARIAIECEIREAVRLAVSDMAVRNDELELQLAGQKLETTVAIVEQTHMLPHIPEEDLYDGT